MKQKIKNPSYIALSSSSKTFIFFSEKKFTFLRFDYNTLTNNTLAPKKTVKMTLKNISNFSYLDSI